MSNRLRPRSGKLIAVGTGDGERVTCDGILDLLNQFCTSVNAERTPHMAILIHLASAFDQVLQGKASMDEALGLKHDRPGRHRRFIGRPLVLDSDRALAACFRDRRLALWIHQYVKDGHKITFAYGLAVKKELKDKGIPVSISTARRAWKNYGGELQWAERLEPANKVLTHEKSKVIYRQLLKELPKLEQQLNSLDKDRRLLALRAARLCGEIYGRVVGPNQEPLVIELLWDCRQLLGPRQILNLYLKQDLMTEAAAKKEWLRGYRDGMGVLGKPLRQGSTRNATPRRT
ncbi:MAG: hypothetical protein C0404_14150 [Verrucomicrobia bacterium]|nr:hypothetical protein [Verrucomicrobiota bacterium]